MFGKTGGFALARTPAGSLNSGVSQMSRLLAYIVENVERNLFL
jgi:hypothetical protein